MLNGTCTKGVGRPSLLPDTPVVGFVSLKPMTLPRRLHPALALFVAAAGLEAAEAPLAAIVREDFTFAAAQSGRMLEQLKGKAGYPRTLENGEIKLIGFKDWTSGFSPRLAVVSRRSHR